MGKFFSTLFASLSSAARIIISFLFPVLKSEVGPIIAAALPIALQIVSSLAAGNYSGTAKKEQAFTQLRNVLVSQGKDDVATRTINLIIEMAVSRLEAS